MNTKCDDYINNVEYAKFVINEKLNKARTNFNEEKNEENKKEYLSLINDLRKINLSDEEVIKKYVKE